MNETPKSETKIDLRECGLIVADWRGVEQCGIRARLDEIAFRQSFLFALRGESGKVGQKELKRGKKWPFWPVFASKTGVFVYLSVKRCFCLSCLFYGC
jgi:hypothetical protein